MASILIGIFMKIFSALGLIHGFPRTALLIDWAITLGLTAAARFVYSWIGGFSAILPQMDPIKTIKAEWKTWLKFGSGYFLPLGIALAGYMLFWHALTRERADKTLVGHHLHSIWSTGGINVAVLWVSR
jgi:hypothetical protein